jgi:hypothetical protein
MHPNPTPAQGAGSGARTSPVPEHPPFCPIIPAPEQVAGVYRYYHQGEVVYVGESHHIFRRLGQHQYRGKIIFDSYDYTPVNDPEERLRVELYYIQLHRPRYNRDGLPYEPKRYILPEIGWRALVGRMPRRWGSKAVLALAKQLGLSLQKGPRVKRETVILLMEAAEQQVKNPAAQAGVR